MTVQEIREAAKVMEAYANGKKIQCNDNHLGNGEWVTTDNPSFNWDKYAYRIKPKSQYRPFKTQEECWNEMLKHQPFGWVKRSDTGNFEHIKSVCQETIAFVVTTSYLYEDAFKYYKFPDGTPFGIMED